MSPRGDQSLLHTTILPASAGAPRAARGLARGDHRKRPRAGAAAATLLLAGTCLAGTASAVAASADWPTYAHDDQRTGFQSAPIGITRETVGTLRLRWSVALRQTVTSSPIVVGDTVYVATGTGDVFALDADTGRTRWKRDVGTGVRMTPELVDGRLLVAVYGLFTPMPLHGASMQALDPKTGRVLWKTPLPGVVRGEPIVVGGKIYEGIAGGDLGTRCVPGRIVTMDERTGALLPQVWYTSSKPHNGGGIWAPLSYDGSTIYFGTGNTCDDTGAQNAAVAITPAMKTRWVTSAIAPNGEDEDVGGGAMIHGDAVYIEGKSGMLYALDRGTGAHRWTANLHSTSPGSGGFATPAGDGSVLVVNSGDGSSEPPNRTKLLAFDLSGKRLYEIDQQVGSAPSLGASFVPGVGFASIDKSVVAFDARSGAIEWKFAAADSFYAVPAIATLGVFTVDLSGNVYAFGTIPPSPGALNGVATVSHSDRPDLGENGTPAPAHRLRNAALAGAAIIVVLVVVAVLVLRRRRGR